MVGRRQTPEHLGGEVGRARDRRCARRVRSGGLGLALLLAQRAHGLLALLLARPVQDRARRRGGPSRAGSRLASRPEASTRCAARRSRRARSPARARGAPRPHGSLARRGSPPRAPPAPRSDHSTWGLASATSGASGPTRYTSSRCDTPSCGAARPTPKASPMMPAHARHLVAQGIVEAVHRSGPRLEHRVAEPPMNDIAAMRRASSSGSSRSSSSCSACSPLQLVVLAHGNESR